MKRHKNRVEANAQRELGLGGRCASSRYEANWIPFCDSVRMRHRRVNLHERVRDRIHELFYTTGLSSRLIVMHDATGSEVQGVFAIWLFCRTAVLNRMKLRSSARHGEPIKKKTWRAGMVSARAWPEHSVLMCDAFISKAGIVGDSSGGRPAKACEYFLWSDW